MNDYYKILGLEDHPADLREAKKAYAKRLRKTRPDDDPEGFMKLREALNSAQNYIANREYYAAQEKAEAQKETKEEETTEEETRTDTQTRPQPTQIHEAENTAQTAHEIHDNAAQSDDTSEPQPEPVIEEIEQTGDQILMSRLSKAFNDPFLKNDKAHWASILDDKDNLSIDEYIDFEERFLSALINAYNSWIENKKENSSLKRPIPTNIENLIFDKMEWRTLQDVDSYKAGQINWLSGQFLLFNRTASPELQQARTQNQENKDSSASSVWDIIWLVVGVFFILRLIAMVFENIAQ